MAYIKKKRKEKAVNIDFKFQLNTNLVKLRKNFVGNTCARVSFLIKLQARCFQARCFAKNLLRTPLQNTSGDCVCDASQKSDEILENNSQYFS